MIDANDIDVNLVGEDQGSVTFRFDNRSGKRVYDLVKLYVGDRYISFGYMDIPPGEEDEIVFSARNVDLEPDRRVVLTTKSPEDGVIMDSRYGEVPQVGKTSDSGGVSAGMEGPEPVEEPDSLGPEAEDDPDPGREAALLPSQEDVEEPDDDTPTEEDDFQSPPVPEPEAEGELPEADSEADVVGEDPHEDPPEGPGEASGGGLSRRLMSLFDRGSHGREEDVEQEEVGMAEAREEYEQMRQEPREQPPQSEPLPSERIDRISTGINGLDSKMQGGLVEGTMNLVTGKTGTGKTAFSASFLKQGAEEGQKGVYVTTEERKEDIHSDIRAMFGWDFEEYEDDDLMKVMSIKPIFPSKEIENLNRLVRSYITDLLNDVKTSIDELDADRVVIDSVSIIEMFIRDEYMARVALSKLLNSLREEDVTAVLTGTVPETSEGLSGGGIIEYLVDAVILLEFVPVAEEHTRTLTVRKMRRTDHDVEIFPLEITPSGMRIMELRR